MNEIEIVCINKDNGNHYNQHMGITHYGWINHSNGKQDKSTRQQMVTWLESSTSNKAYVKDRADGSKVYCYVREMFGIKFIQTRANDTYRDNLLSLKECVY